MGQSTELAQYTIATPAEVVEAATIQARQLMDIVQKTKCYKDIRGRKYLQVEAWETIGAFNRIHAETKEVTRILKDGEVIGYTAHVILVRDGEVVGGAIMPAYFTDNCCKGKVGDEKHKACMSAAQTFATSKAYRMNFSYIAILAGYEPLPAEEVAEEDERQAAANPITSTVLIDIDWLRDALIELHWADCGRWLREHYPHARGGSIRAIVESLTPREQEEFVAEVQRRLDAKKGGEP